MRSKGAKFKKARAKDLFGILIIIFAVGLIAFVAEINLSTEKNKQDDKTHCLESGAKKYLAILIDDSDELSETQQKWLIKYFDVVKNETATNEWVGVYTFSFGLREKPFRPIWEGCNPGNPDEEGEWTGNKKMAKKIWDEFFGNPLGNKIKQVTKTGDELTLSPIMEMIKRVVIDAFPVVGRDRPMDIVIVSDMLENTPRYSHYRDPISFEWFKKNGVVDAYRVDMEGITIKLIYVLRTKWSKYQSQEHREFWREYIRELGGSVVNEIPTVSG